MNRLPLAEKDGITCFAKNDAHLMEVCYQVAVELCFADHKIKHQSKDWQLEKMILLTVI